MTCFFERALEGEVELLERLAGGKRAERMGPSPPCASRVEVSVLKLGGGAHAINWS